MIETRVSSLCSTSASSSSTEEVLVQIPRLFAAFGCTRRRKGTRIALDQPSTSSLQHVANSWPSELPETVLAIVLEFAGPSARYSTSCANKEWHEVVWQSPSLWSSVLLSLGEEPGRVEQDVTRQRDRARKCWFGITNFIMQGSQPGIGCEVVLIEEATRAIKGLHSTDNAEEKALALERCLGLLRAFQINDTMARSEAVKLEALIAARTDIFNPEQRQQATDALAEASELCTLLDDALQMPTFLDLDALDEDSMEAMAANTGAWCCEEDQDQSISHSNEFSDEALDRLLSVLCDAVVSPK